MIPKDKDESSGTSPSMFRKLAFRNPFSSSNADKSPTTAGPSRRATLPISPTSTRTTTNATNSGFVSTMPSGGTTAATSPGSEHCPQPELQSYMSQRFPGKGLQITIPPYNGNHRISVSSSEVSPLGGPRVGPRWRSIAHRGAAVDGGSDSLQSNLSVSKSAKMSPLRLTGSPLTISRPTSLADSFRSRQSEQSIRSVDSYGSFIGDGGEWDPEVLVELTDAVRAELKTNGIVPQCNLQELTLLIEALLQEESSPQPSTEIGLLIHSRLDELLKDIVDAKDTMCGNSDREQVALFIKAGSLMRKWEKRFVGYDIHIHKARIEEMKINGGLRGLTPIKGVVGLGLTWRAGYMRPTGPEGHGNFMPGDWWLNMHAALRDGIVGSADQMLTMKMSAVVALALLTGEEVDGPTQTLFKYTKVGKRMDELMKLLACNQGLPIRILRGKNLQSKYAPEAGFRYDGLYVVKQFGHKLLDETQNICRYTIMLERCTLQKPLSEVLRYPKPSQLDEWKLYKKVMGEEYRKREGEVAFEMWRELEEELQADKEQFIKSRALEDGIRKYTFMDMMER